MLAGGLGTRIRDRFPDVPKPLIPVSGRPFVEWLITYFRREGAQRFVLATGHLGRVVDAYLAARRDDGAAVVAVREPRPLGTAGALRHAVAALPSPAGVGVVAGDAVASDVVAVTNGDSLVLADLAPAWDALDDPAIDGAIVGVPVPDAARYGTLTVGADGRLLGFAEKQPGKRVINAGIYLLRRRLIDAIPPDVPVSLEREVLPAWVGRGAHISVHVTAAPFLDIGTPESLDHADAFVAAAFP